MNFKAHICYIKSFQNETYFKSWFRGDKGPLRLSQDWNLFQYLFFQILNQVTLLGLLQLMLLGHWIQEFLIQILNLIQYQLRVKINAWKCLGLLISWKVRVWGAQKRLSELVELLGFNSYCFSTHFLDGRYFLKRANHTIYLSYIQFFIYLIQSKFQIPRFNFFAYHC